MVSPVYIRWNMNSKPIAWYYELAACYLPETKKYVNFNPRLSFNKPNVPKGSIRNLKPLYEKSK